MIKVQLIQAPRNEGYAPNSRSACYPHLGLISIGTHVRSVFPDADVEILDGELLSLAEIAERLKPGAFVGIETKMLNYSSALKLAQRAKELGCIVIFGGVYATAIPQTIMDRRGAVVDYLVAGYGEKAFVSVISGELGLEPKQPRIIFHPSPDFDSLRLPDRSFFVDLSHYIQNFRESHPRWAQHTVTNIFTQQGCQHKCMFCARLTPGIRVVSFRDPQSIWDEVQALNQQYGIDYLVSFDDQIAQDLDWLRRLVDLKPKGQEEVLWHVFSTAENITPESLKLLQSLPTKHIFVGIETGDPELAKTVGKGRGFSLETCLRAVRFIAEAGIGLTPSFIHGLRGENEDSLKRTFDFAQRIQSETQFEEIFAACLIPFPGTVAFRMLCERYPELANEDELDGEELSKLWFDQFCEVEYETAREYTGRILELAPYTITLDKGGHVI